MVEHLVNPLPTNSGVLLVEGQDDKHMVWHLCRQDPSFDVSREFEVFDVSLRSNSSTFRIMERGGRANLLESIAGQLNTSNRHPIGVLVDADDDLGKCWDAVMDAFDGTEVQLPSKPKPSGTIILGHGFTPTVGIWLMPDNKSHGEVENFALRMIRQNDPVWPLSKRYIEDVPDADRKFAPDKIDKAKVHAWLATKKEPGRLAAAVGAGELDVTGMLCKDFLNWIKELFS